MMLAIANILLYYILISGRMQDLNSNIPNLIDPNDKKLWSSIQSYLL